MRLYNKHLAVIMGLTAVVAGIAATLPLQPKYKNLKVLPKDITQFELTQVMDGFERGLGVECYYCHKQDKDSGEYDYANEEKGEKEIARKMMRMTMDINKKYFHYGKDKKVPATVTCYTCHNGKSMPEIETDIRLKKN
ncbi:MAG: hypothetical protein JWQ27_667 [Ferruginibacter sp.]|nr:hypothetical protein [Ferruginibacter sp.]